MMLWIGLEVRVGIDWGVPRSMKLGISIEGIMESQR
jgi:hypothetical protein